ncbi:hypothetical protein AB8A28_09130 [Tardiphaga sp. 71_E8_N1_1]
MALLKECYSKDFSAVIADVGFDERPYELFSASVDAEALSLRNA